MTTKNTVSVRISGVKGRVDIELNQGATAAEVLAEAAEALGIPAPIGVAILVDGTQVEPEAPVEGAAKVDAVPKPNLG